ASATSGAAPAHGGRRGVGARDLFPGWHQRAGHLSGRAFRAAHARARRAVPTRLQPRPESVLRLQLGVSLSRALAGELDHGARRGGRALRGERPPCPKLGARGTARGAVRSLALALGAWIVALSPLAIPAGSSAPAGSWRAVLDLAGGTLPFTLELAPSGARWTGTL